MSNAILFPCAVVIDTREQLPYTFDGFRTEARRGRRPLRIPTVRAKLPNGDYSLAGHETSVAIERKSMADLFHTLGQERERFGRELERLADYRFAAVVMECTYEDIIKRPPEFSRLSPRSVLRTILAWEVRLPVKWVPAGSRTMGNAVTFRLLEKYLKSHEPE